LDRSTDRSAGAANTNPDGLGPLVVYLADGKTLYQAAKYPLDEMEQRNWTASASMAGFDPCHCRAHIIGVDCTEKMEP